MAYNLWSANNFVEREMRKERAFRESSNLLQIYSREDVISQFHLSKETILSLAGELAPVLPVVTH